MGVVGIDGVWTTAGEGGRQRGRWRCGDATQNHLRVLAEAAAAVRAVFALAG